MSKGHDFNFFGGEILSNIGASWFVSYTYYKNIDKNHVAWNNPSYSRLSVQSRINKYNTSTKYHFEWLNRVLEMKQLDTHKNKCELNSKEIQIMAAEILLRIVNE